MSESTSQSWLQKEIIRASKSIDLMSPYYKAAGVDLGARSDTLTRHTNTKTEQRK